GDFIEAGALINLDEVQPCGMDLDQRLSRPRYRLLNLLIPEHLGSTGFVNANRLHG
ncbi:MAG: hypothetical protein K0S19_1482, partial [Geminicoccaceae bacterium]|nr:hypothetical protein [Geminicoccaceae bacterium]